MKIFTLHLLLPAALALHSAPGSEDPDFQRVLESVQKKVADVRAQLGGKAGEPEVPDRFEPIPKGARRLSAEEARAAFAPAVAWIERNRWWRIGLDPTQLTDALRQPASVISGCVAAHRAGLAEARAMELAREAADFLVWAQEQAGNGVFPFPAARGVRGDKAFEAADRVLGRIERSGRLGEVVRHGWAIDDLGNGGLQFDNGEAGLAIFELAEATGYARYRASGVRSAEWALAQPLCENWNYNAFSVTLLAKAFQVTGDDRFLEGAKRKALLGVIPGQLTDGLRAGRWLDPHNARPAYHYIMMRALAGVVAALPERDPARAEIKAALHRGLRARNADLLGPGAATKDKAMEALLYVDAAFEKDRAFLDETLTTPALDALGRLVSEQSRRGRGPLSPRGWGQFLARIVTKG